MFDPDWSAELADAQSVYERAYATRDELVCDAYRNGMTMKEIATALGKSNSGVEAILKRHDVPRRPKSARPGHGGNQYTK